MAFDFKLRTARRRDGRLHPAGPPPTPKRGTLDFSTPGAGAALALISEDF